jgi:hypothetical protein
MTWGNKSDNAKEPNPGIDGTQPVRRRTEQKECCIAGKAPASGHGGVTEQKWPRGMADPRKAGEVRRRVKLMQCTMAF